MSTTTTARTTKLSQIVAVVSGVKARTQEALTAAYHQSQKPAPFSGIARTYRPLDDEGEALPPESTLVQVRAEDLIADVRAALTRMLDVVATQEWANTQARADVVVGGVVLLHDVPVTYLMWLEKQVVLLRSFVAKLPTLDVAEKWHWDQDAQAYATAPLSTTRRTKIPRNHVVAKATDRHPEQVQVYHEDVVIGYWSTIRYSGAIHASRVFELAERVEKLLDAIRFAREQANMRTVEDIHAGDPLMEYLFGESLSPKHPV